MKTTKPSNGKPQSKMFNKTVDMLTKQSKVRRMSELNKNDRLEVLKRKYEAEIHAKEAELAELKIKLRNLEQFAQESEVLSNKYANSGTTEAALDAVNAIWQDGGDRKITTALIRDYMLAHGFKPNTDNFDITLSITLKRLLDAGKIALSSSGPSRKLYRPDRFALENKNRGRSLRPK